MNSKKRNAPGEEGARSTRLAGGVAGQRKVIRCTNNHISKLRRALRAAGLLLSSTRTETQIDTLLRILQYRGEAGINTPEGVGCGFARIATRVFDLELLGWRIDTVREDVIMADGLKHKGIARYILRGHRTDVSDPQARLDLGE